MACSAARPETASPCWARLRSRALVYGVLAVALGAVRREDLLALPKGEKIADKLHLR